MKQTRQNTSHIPEIRDTKTLLEAILKNRWADGMMESAAFFSPTLDHLHDPFLFPGMSQAVERILKARENRERVVIFGDYDVDGVSSTAMLLRFLTMIGLETSYRIPHRVTDGYGMKPYFFDELSQKDVQLVISVDCGTRDIETIRHAKSIGIDVIVTDHHAVPEIIPEEAVAIISPKLPGTPYPFSGLSGSGTAFKLLCAVASKIYPNQEAYHEIIESFIDFAALGTVADMMPLIGENRTIVRLGLERMPKSRSPGLRAMISGKSTHSADIIGFHIGPRINAAGRIASAELALKSLVCGESQIEPLLEELEELNHQRREGTERFVQIALEAVDPTKPVIIFESEDLHHGIMWLVAGKLAEHFGKPAIACAREETKLVGSARSREGYHITNALERMSDCFVAFGGHAQAAGFTIEVSRFEEFIHRLEQDAQEFIHTEETSEGGGGAWESGFTIGDTENCHALLGKSDLSTVDGILPLEIINTKLVRTIESIGPFGIGFPKPRFLVQFDDMPKWEHMGNGNFHVRFDMPKGLKMIGFNMGTELSKSWKQLGQWYALVELDRETWQGKESVVLHVKEIFKFSS